MNNEFVIKDFSEVTLVLNDTTKAFYLDQFSFGGKEIFNFSNVIFSDGCFFIKNKPLFEPDVQDFPMLMILDSLKGLNESFNFIFSGSNLFLPARVFPISVINQSTPELLLKDATNWLSNPKGQEGSYEDLLRIFIARIKEVLEVCATFELHNEAFFNAHDDFIKQNKDMELSVADILINKEDIDITYIVSLYKAIQELAYKKGSNPYKTELMQRFISKPDSDYKWLFVSFRELLKSLRGTIRNRKAIFESPMTKETFAAISDKRKFFLSLRLN